MKKGKLIELIQGYNVDIIFNYDYVNTVNYLLKDKNIIQKSFNDNITYNLNIDTGFYNNLINNNNIKINIIKEILIEKEDINS